VPTYQYACTNPEGKHEFERVQSFTDAPVSECPVCGAPVRKVYGSVGVVFKGSGFYRTDSRQAASAAHSASGDGGSKAKDSSTSSSSSSSPSSSSSSSSASTGSSSGSAGSTAAG
jgi:putative FmdB family regulatory protein